MCLQRTVCAITLGLATPIASWAAGLPAVGLEEVVVTAKRVQLIGQVASASQGTVLNEQLEN